jgi:hypothetical protein
MSRRTLSPAREVVRWLRSSSPPGNVWSWNTLPPTPPWPRSGAVPKRCSGSTTANRPRRSPSCSTSAAGRSMTGWIGSTTAPSSTSGSGWPTPRVRAGPTRGAVVSIPGSLRSSTRSRGPSAIARRSGPPPCWCDTYGSITRSRSRVRRSAGPSHAWGSAGSGHGISWHSARRPGVRRKGAETRAGRPRPHGPAHAR